MRSNFFDNKVVSYLMKRKKYVIVIIVFIIAITLFDQNSVFSQMKLSNELSSLKEQNRYYKEQIVLNKKRLKQLRTDKENLEKFAREQYLMKRSDEDIFVIIEE